jgi:hypothetical protein
MKIKNALISIMSVLVVATMFLSNDAMAVNDETMPIVNIQPNQVITSPLVIEGNSNGAWTANEANMGTVTLVDDNGRILAISGLPTEGEWMTTDPVKFGTILEFDPEGTQQGTLIFKNENPSDMRELDKSFEIPVVFAQSATEEKNITNKIPPENCKVWFDGCNTCIRTDSSQDMVCTQMACAQSDVAYCKEYFTKTVVENENIFVRLWHFIINSFW